MNIRSKPILALLVVLKLPLTADADSKLALGEVALLSALPKAWPSGSVKGLRQGCIKLRLAQLRGADFQSLQFRQWGEGA